MSDADIHRTITDLVQEEAHTSPRVVGLALAGAVAVYVWCLTAMHSLAGAPMVERSVTPAPWNWGSR